MINFKRTLLTAISVVLLMPAPQVVLGQTVDFNDPMLIYKEVGANKDQQTKIRALQMEFEAASKPKVARAMQLLKQIHDYSLLPSPDNETVMSTQEEINELQAEMANSRLQMMLNIRYILTPAQRKKLVQRLKEKPPREAE